MHDSIFLQFLLSVNFKDPVAAANMNSARNCLQLNRLLGVQPLDLILVDYYNMLLKENLDIHLSVNLLPLADTHSLTDFK